ncbi:DUF1772 domain-containing protein [Sinosporangium siamense]|uniref:DUF1772 domain-containing protein n=1 Tax=Sinosporangium siamense TaxID=1367973 RepID=UPI001EF2DB12|nr:DUF1772 domain-containing protein [Sinosporangium siamense]
MLVPLALLCSGLAAGGLVISALGGAPLLLALSTENYVPVHQFLVRRFDPFMPLCLCGALVVDVVLAVVTPSLTASILFGSAVAVYLATVAVSLLRNVPINKWVYSLDPHNLPEDWERLDPRVRWRNWNLVRTSLAATGLLLNATAVGFLL